MANTHLVTGYSGQVHVTSADQGVFNATLFGSGEFVFGKGNRLAASVISNNLIRVLDGDIYMQGRHIRINEGTYVDLAIENGTQGLMRNDLIVARYTRNAATAVEEVNLMVIKGTAVANSPVDPAYTSGNIIEDHAVLNDMPLYRVPIDGLAVGELVPLFSTFEQTILEIYAAVVNNKTAGDNALSAHTKSRSNPHGVTAAQVGTYTVEQIEAKLGYNRAETLSSLSKSIFGLASDAVPDAVFEFLGKYNQHWWRTRSESGQWTISKGELFNKEVQYWNGESGSESTTVQCGTSVVLDENNKLKLSGTIQTLTINPTVASVNQLRDKYFIGGIYDYSGNVYYSPGNSAWMERESTGGVYDERYYLPVQLVQAYYATSGEINYVHSTNRNAYPDSSTVSGITYWYLGIPFDNAVKAPKCASGAYVGSGTYGSGSPNKVQLDFTPRFAIVLPAECEKSTYGSFTSLFWVEGQTKFGNITISANGNVLSWYGSAAANQLNESGKKYLYYVCG